MKMIGIASNPPEDQDRTPINVHPLVVKDLRTLLFEPEMRGVGYSEFIARAISIARSEIAQERQEDTEH